MILEENVTKFAEASIRKKKAERGLKWRLRLHPKRLIAHSGG